MRYEQDNSRRITLVSVNTVELRGCVEESQFKQRGDQYEYQDEESDSDHKNDYISDPGTDYMDVGREMNRMTLPFERGETARPGPNAMILAGVPADQSG